MWGDVGKKKVKLFSTGEQGMASDQSEVVASQGEREEVAEKRKKALKYNRGKYGVFGDPKEPELVQR